MKTILLFLALFGSALAQITVTPSGGGSGTPGGSNTQVQYNNASAFGGITGLTFSGTTLTGASGFTLDMSAATVLLPPFSVPFLLPSSAAPTVDALGEIAADSDFFAASKGALLWYDGTGVRVVPAYTNAVAPTDGQALVWDNTNKWWEPGVSSNVRSFGVTIDGAGSAISTGVKGDITIPFACTISSVTMLADQSGSIVVDVWKDNYANYPPTVADTITASAKPTITTATKSQNTTLTGWTVAVAAGDTIRFNVDSATTVTRVTLVIKATSN